MRLLRFTLAAFILCLAPAWTEIAPVVSITELVHSADLIIVGRVEHVRQTGAGEINFHGQSYARRDFQAEINVDETIKGESAASQFALNYSTPAMDSLGNVAEGSLTPNTFQVLFLRKTGDGYAFVSPYSPSLPASSRLCGAEWQLRLGEDAYRKVLQRVLDVLCTSSTTGDKLAALNILNWGEDSSVAPFLKAALNLPEVNSNPLLRTTILGDLLKWKDLSVLPLAENDLFEPSKHVDANLKSNLLLAISSLNPHLSVPLLTRALTLSEPEARVGAARFLEYTNSDTAVDGLLSALDDRDRDVQFQIMQSLGNLTNQRQWRPQTTTKDATWLACIEHWHEFGEQRRRKLGSSSAN